MHLDNFKKKKLPIIVSKTAPIRLKPRKQLGHGKELGITYVQKESSMGIASCKGNSRVIPSVTGKMIEAED